MNNDGTVLRNGLQEDIESGAVMMNKRAEPEVVGDDHHQNPALTMAMQVP